MLNASLLFPHQLFLEHELYRLDQPLYLIEEHLFFNQYPFHKTKLAFHRASMHAHAEKLREKDLELHYVDATSSEADIRQLIPALAKKGVEHISYINPTDNWLSTRIHAAANKHDIELQEFENPLFINSREDLSGFFKPDKKSYFQTTFYKQQRKQRAILIDSQGEPLGGKWSFDADNREKYPKDKTPPELKFPSSDAHWLDAIDYVQTHYADNLGQVSETAYFPYTHKQADAWLTRFFEQRFYDFGTYEDAIVKDETFLHHSVLTPMLNVGLLSPMKIVEKAIDYAEAHDIPINSLEGFVRQIIGWREFIRGMYACKGVQARTTNFWGFDRSIPDMFYDGSTGIAPVDDVIKKVLQYGYCHHIERLMVLGNFMLLCEFDPKAVYRWFMELFVDAYDWVMVPNVYGMSQFADGGLFATKPYISGSNYICKMSDYSKSEDWTATWDGLFWRFMHLHRDFFLGNPRLGMLVRTFDKMSEEKQQAHLDQAEAFLESI